MRTTRRNWAVIVMTIVATAASHAHASCTFGASGETSLQGVFDSVLGPGSLSATDDCLAPSSDTFWSAQGRAAATIVVEVTGAGSGNVFGIYDPRHRKSRQVSIFDGSASTGSSTFQLRPNGKGYDVFANDEFEGQFASNTFGFFLRTPDNGTFFSQPKRNRDRADHMYAYAGNGTPFRDGPLDGSLFATSMYLLAFEDSRVCRKRTARPSCGDADFQDFVATVKFIAPIPIASSGAMLGVALALLTVWRRRAVADSTSN